MSTDMSLPSKATAECKEIYECIKKLTDDETSRDLICIYNAEMDGEEGEELAAELNKKIIQLPSRFLIVRQFT